MSNNYGMGEQEANKRTTVFKEANHMSSELAKLNAAISELKELLAPVMSEQSVCEAKDAPLLEPDVCRVAERFRSARYYVIDILNNVKDIISRLEIYEDCCPDTKK